MPLGSATATATQKVTLASEDSLKKSMTGYTSGTTLSYTLNINSNGEDLVYVDENSKDKKDVLEIMDVMSSKMSLAVWKENYFVVTDSEGNRLTAAASEDIGANEYYVTKVDDAENTVYKIIVPDGKALTITYLVTVDAAIGEKVDASNKAYFVYEGLKPEDTAKEAGSEIVIANARGGTGTSADASFKIYKQDQWGGAVAGATFTLYKVKLDSNGAAIYENNQVALESTPVATKTTDANGFVEFTDLDGEAVYCFYETEVPTGYALSTERTYFYFTYHENLGISDATGIDYNEKIFTVTNRFSAANLPVSLEKTINGEKQSSTREFGFTLTKTSGGAVYSDEKCTTEVTSLTATIAGSGTTSFGTLYFREPGTWQFALSENALTQEETNEGFKKSDVVYTITVKVVNGSNGLSVESADYTGTDAKGNHTGTGDLAKGDIPTFNNTLTLDPVTVTLNATKRLTGDARGYQIREGEFTFEVVENGEVIATGKTKAGSATSSEIEFTGITYNQKELGTHVVTIYEVTGSNPTITYSEVKFFAKIVVEPIPGQAKLQATVVYSTQNRENLDENGEPIFSNRYTYTVPTGIRLDVLPYVVIFAAVLAGGCIGVTMKLRRRKRQE
jgi:hypothetical protein